MEPVPNTRPCRKCGEYIPRQIKIDGKYKTLQNRKFCLKCSAYRVHNTSSTNPDDRKVPGKKKRVYNLEIGRKQNISLYKRALERKQTLIERSGGKCLGCGYCKDFRALSFHHRIPEEKEFGLSLNNLWSKTWEKIENEHKKCDLYCLNCHAELEGDKSQMVDRVNKHYGTNF